MTDEPKTRQGVRNLDAIKVSRDSIIVYNKIAGLFYGPGDVVDLMPTVLRLRAHPACTQAEAAFRLGAEPEELRRILGPMESWPIARGRS